MHIALQTVIINVAPTTLLICNGDRCYIHIYILTNEWKILRALPRLGLTLFLPVVGGICNGQAVGYFIHLLWEWTLRSTLFRPTLWFSGTKNFATYVTICTFPTYICS